MWPDTSSQVMSGAQIASIGSTLWVLKAAMNSSDHDIATPVRLDDRIATQPRRSYSDVKGCEAALSGRGRARCARTDRAANLRWQGKIDELANHVQHLYSQGLVVEVGDKGMGDRATHDTCKRSQSNAVVR